MERLKAMDAVQLEQHLQRLERDVEDFRLRVATVAAALGREGRTTLSDPLHQRLTSIHRFLREELTHARQEVAWRAEIAPAPARWSVRSLLRLVPFASGG